MFANKCILLPLLILVFIGIGCIPSATPTFPTAQPEPTVTPIYQQPTSTVFIGIPLVSNPLIQSDNESKDEFVVRIAATKIIGERPFLIALSQIGKENLWFGVSRDIKDIEKCWFYEVDSTRPSVTIMMRHSYPIV